MLIDRYDYCRLAIVERAILAGVEVVRLSVCDPVGIIHTVFGRNAKLAWAGFPRLRFTRAPYPYHVLSNPAAWSDRPGTGLNGD
jgi:hypothetical protein